MSDWICLTLADRGDRLHLPRLGFAFSPERRPQAVDKPGCIIWFAGVVIYVKETEAQIKKLVGIRE